MGLAAVSKGSASCRAGQCARCAPASRLGAPALPERGSALAPRGWGGASCPGCPQGGLGSARSPVLPRWVQQRLPGVLAGGCETLGQGGGFCLPRSVPEGPWLGFSPCSSPERVPGDLAQPTWGGGSGGAVPHPSEQQRWVLSLKPRSRNGDAKLVVRSLSQGGWVLPLHPAGARPAVGAGAGVRRGPAARLGVGGAACGPSCGAAGACARGAALGGVN